MRYRRNADYDLRHLERLAAGGDTQVIQRLRAMRIRSGLCVDCGSGLGPCKTALDNDIEECEEFTCNKCGCDTFKCEWVREVNGCLDEVKHFSASSMPNCEGCGTEGQDEDEYDIDLAEEPHFSWSPCEVCNSHLGGDRYPAHGYIDFQSSLDARQDLVHINICADCLHYFANGDIPEDV